MSHTPATDSAAAPLGGGESPNPRAEAAAGLLVRARTAGAKLDALPTEAKPGDKADAYAAQVLIAQARAEDTAGWKIAATSLDGQRHINVPGPLGGRLLSSEVYGNGETVDLGNNAMWLAELEFVFVFAQDLAARPEEYTREEVLAAIGELRLGIELPSSRFVDPATVGELGLIADNACTGEFVLGPVVAAGWEPEVLPQTRVTVTVSGGATGRDEDAAEAGAQATPADTESAQPGVPRVSYGIGENVMGDPVEALRWLVNELSALGHPLHAGQFVTTGTCCAPVPVRPGETLSAEFTGLGTVECSFA